MENPFEFLVRVVNIVLDALGKYEDKFTFEKVSTSSYFTFKSPRHVEFLVSLKTVDTSQFVIEEQGMPPGLTKVRMVDASSLWKWRDFCGRNKTGKEYFSCRLISMKLTALLQNFVNDLHYMQTYGRGSGIEIGNYSFQNSSCFTVKFQGILYCVELTPAIACTGLWTYSSLQWRLRNLSWPDNTHKRQILNNGIHLVAKPGASEYHWVVWFANAEKVLLTYERLKCKQECHKLIKKLFDKNHIGPSCVLSSYHLQTVLLYECEKFPRQEEWTHAKIRQRFVGLLRSVQDCLYKGVCPHFFIQNFNLLRGCEIRQMTALAQRLEQVIENPEEYVEDLGPTITPLQISSTFPCDSDDIMETRL